MVDRYRAEHEEMEAAVWRWWHRTGSFSSTLAKDLFADAALSSGTSSGSALALTQLHVCVVMLMFNTVGVSRKTNCGLMDLS